MPHLDLTFDRNAANTADVTEHDIAEAVAAAQIPRMSATADEIQLHTTHTDMQC